MSDALTISVVIVSRGRPDALRRCLLGVSQLSYEMFEVVVVADPAGCAVVTAMPQGLDIKLIEFDEANISAARNLGITAAAGAVIAFIDDDSVPEPSWLDFLAAPFVEPKVMAAGGFVRGRNGISWQSCANLVDRTGRTTPINVDPIKATILTPTPDRAIRTEGTNMAVRRDCLAKIGGFDPSYRFFLDETDLNLRLADHGYATAIVPSAEVHHGFHASAGRRADRVPTDLYEIGASWAVFLAKFCPADQRGAVWKSVQAEQRQRALSHLISGGLEPRDVGRLMRRLIKGYQDGMDRPASLMPDLPHPPEAFCPYPRSNKTQSTLLTTLLTGRVWNRRAQRRDATRLVAMGKVVTALRFSPTAMFHRVAFRSDGYWEHIGGVFGKSERSQKVFTIWSFRRRVREEVGRISAVRRLGQRGSAPIIESKRN